MSSNVILTTARTQRQQCYALRAQAKTVDWNTVPWFVQQSEQPTCFFQEDPGHRRTPWYVSHPAVCHLWVAVLPRPSLQWQTPALQNAGNFHLVPEPTVERKIEAAIFQAYREKQKTQKTLQPMNKMRAHTHREWKPSGFHLHPQCSHILAQIWRKMGKKKKSHGIYS